MQATTSAQPAAAIAVFELALVLLTAAAFAVCDEWPHAKGPFIVGCGLFWLSYLFFRGRTRPGLWREWGFGRRNLLPASVACGIAVLIGAAGMLLYGFARGGVSLPAAAWLLLVLYVPWGLLQQFLLNAMVARNLFQLLGRTRTVPALRIGVAIAVPALLFGLVHLPDLTPTALTCAAGIVWVSIYLRWPNLWPLGVSHVLLGVVAYYVVLGRDPLAEIFAALR